MPTVLSTLKRWQLSQAPDAALDTRAKKAKLDCSQLGMQDGSQPSTPVEDASDCQNIKTQSDGRIERDVNHAWKRDFGIKDNRGCSRINQINRDRYASIPPGIDRFRAWKVAVATTLKINAAQNYSDSAAFFFGEKPVHVRRACEQIPSTSQTMSRSSSSSSGPPPLEDSSDSDLPDTKDELSDDGTDSDDDSVLMDLRDFMHRLRLQKVRTSPQTTCIRAT